MKIPLLSPLRAKDPRKPLAGDGSIFSPTMISSGDIKYLAGLWEGEGCFLLVKPSTPGMSLLMTDRDVIESAARLMGYERPVYLRPPGCQKDQCVRKPTYQFRLSTALSVQWMMTLYPLLGARRRAKIAQLVALWKTSQLPARMRRECPQGHPYIPANTELRRQRGKSYRSCRICRQKQGRQSAGQRRP